MIASIPTLISLLAAGISLLCTALAVPQKGTRPSLAWAGSASGVVGLVAASAGSIRPPDLAAVAGIVLLGGVAGAGWSPRGNVNRSWWPLLKRTGLPRIPFHNLRHAAATLLLSRNTHPKLVSELLGHADITTTLNTYSHVIPSMGGKMVSAMEALLGEEYEE